VDQYDEYFNTVSLSTSTAALGLTVMSDTVQFVLSVSMYKWLY
jgi:hypothetical protein